MNILVLSSQPIAKSIAKTCNAEGLSCIIGKPINEIEQMIKGIIGTVIGNDLDGVKTAVEELRRRVCEKDARWHIHEIGLEKAGYTVEQYRELFFWALEMDNVLVSPTLKGEA